MALVSFYKHPANTAEPDFYVNTDKVMWVTAYGNHTRIGFAFGCVFDIEGDLEGVVSALTEGR